MTNANGGTQATETWIETRDSEASLCARGFAYVSLGGGRFSVLSTPARPFRSTSVDWAAIARSAAARYAVEVAS